MRSLKGMNERKHLRRRRGKKRRKVFGHGSRRKVDGFPDGNVKWIEPDTDEAASGDIETFPPSYWQKIKAYTTVPVICKLYTKHELMIENLISTYLHVGGLSAHKALKNYCARRLSAAKPAKFAEEDGEEKQGKLSKVISWINSKLQKWAGRESDEVIAEPNLANAEPRQLVFYPQKLNLVLFPPSLASAQRVTEGEEDANTDTMSAEQLREQMWQEIQQQNWQMTTALPETERKAKRSCFGENCNDRDLSEDRNEQNLKNLNSLAVLISGFDKSPVHSMMGYPGPMEEERVNGVMREQDVGDDANRVRKGEIPEKSANDFDVPLNFHFPPETNFPNRPILQRNDKEKELFEETVEEIMQATSTTIPMVKENFFDYEKKHSLPPLLPPIEVLPETYPPPHIFPPVTQISFTPKTEEKFHPEFPKAFKTMHPGVVFIFPLILVLALLICIGGYFWHKRKQRRKYDMSPSDEESSHGRGRGRHNFVKIKHGSDLVSTDEDGHLSSSRRPSPLREKGDKKSRQRSYEADRRPVGPFKKKKKKLKTSKQGKRDKSRLTTPPLLTDNEWGPEWQHSGTLYSEQDI